MEWLLANPQIHSTFSSLGRMDGDTYVVSPDVLATLEEIYCKLSCEDQILRTYRRALGFGQNVKTDLVPLLLNAKEPAVLDATIRILVNLTVPVECLFSVDVMYRTEVGRHTIFEINKLLITSKEAFTDAKTTKSILDYVKQLLECDSKLSISQCDSINNCLLLLRNILHIPEDNIVTQGHHNSSCTSMQNIIMWNLFIQSIDKLLIYLMSCSRRVHWGVTLVQLIALMYKDQHVSILQKLLNLWVEASLSESSEDNESNTSPPKQGSGDSSPMLTSDPTSDSSDNGSGKQDSSDDCRQLNICKETDSSTGQLINRKGHDYLRVPAKPTTISKNQHEQMQKTVTKHTKNGPNNSGIKDPHQKTLQITDKKQKNFPSPSTSTTQYNSGKCCPKKRECTSPQSELSDCGYGTQVENQESISTSSNEDEFLHKKPIHQKPPTNQKQRYSTANKQRPLISTQDKKELRRKKLVKRSKSNLINMKGLVQHIPTDEDISNILKEFTVDFLLKGYGYLVKELHAQLLSDSKVQIDTSHFFWLVTYFLKFAAQLELDLEHINSVLCFDIVSFLTYEAVMLCEQLDLAARQSESDLKPYLRRMHLVVTAIREIFQALETYKKATHLSEDDKISLRGFELQVSSTEDLRNLFVLLIRRYNPLVQSKQYLQDIIVTNHVLLLFLDRAAKFPESNGNFKTTDHIAHFATVEIMHHYGLLLQDFRENGEFVNDCIFTMMHHIAGDLGKISTLFQPGILKAFSQIWETEYELCDDWSDLIEYVIHKFMNTPRKGPLLPSPSLTEMTKEHNMEHTVCSWTQEEMDTLYWYYVQSKKLRDVVGKIASLFAATDNTRKSRLSIVQQLLQQDIITLVEYDDLMKYEDAEYQRNVTKTPTPSTSTGESGIEIKDAVLGKPSDDIQVLKDRLIKEKKGKMLIWLQKILIECYFVKLNFAAGKTSCKDILELTNVKVMEPIVHHCILKKKSIPIVSWNADQAAVLQYQPFILLLHKLGFHLPADVGKVFVRIPDFWTADILFEIAEKVGPVHKSMVKFDIEVLNNARLNTEELKPLDETPNEGFAIPRIKHSSSLIRFTPDPASKPPVPNWLEVVMRSKSNSADRHEKLCSSPCGTFVIPSTSFTSESSISKMHQSDEDNSQAKEMSNVYSAMVASVYDHDFSNSDETNSVASDLTRMYVSDEDDKHNIGHT